MTDEKPVEEEISRKRPEPCYIIEGKWAEDTDNEENYERTMGREISS